jgi:hypothetical protein
MDSAPVSTCRRASFSSSAASAETPMSAYGASSTSEGSKVRR